MIIFIVWAIELALKCFMAWALFTFGTWMEAPQWLVIAITAAGWCETHLKLKVQ